MGSVVSLRAYLLAGLACEALRFFNEAKKINHTPKWQPHAIRARWPGENPGCVRTPHTI
jgi:hypothetical protein